MSASHSNLKHLFNYQPRSYQTRYLHSRYAGTIGDVFKHVLLLDTLDVCLQRHLRSGSECFHYLETHSGPGLSRLGDGGRWTRGIGCLPQDESINEIRPELSAWVSRALGERNYEGSWSLVAGVLAARSVESRLDLYETNSEVVECMHAVRSRCLASNAIHIHESDGFKAAVNGALDHQLTFVDPPYNVREDGSDDWTAVIHLAQELSRLQRDFVLWYPRFTENRAHRFCQAIGLPAVELIWDNHRQGKSYRSTGCGMIWSPTLFEKLKNKATQWQKLASFWRADLKLRTTF